MERVVEATELRERLAPLIEQGTIHLIVLFGSTVHGLTHHESDLDLAMQGSSPLDVVAVTTEAIRLLHANRVDVVDLRRASPLLMMEVVRGGRLVYEQRPGLYAEFCSLAHRRYVDTAKLRQAQQDAIRQFLDARGVA